MSFKDYVDAEKRLKENSRPPWKTVIKDGFGIWGIIIFFYFLYHILP